MKHMQNPASGRIFTVALDHAPSYGVLAGLETINQIMSTVAAGHPDALLMMKGTCSRCFEPYAGEISLILKCSSLSPYHPQRDVWVSSVEDALRLGADAIAMAMTVGSPEQPHLMRNLAQLVGRAEAFALPVIVHAYPNGELVPPEEHYTVERVAYATRMAVELGVDIVKTFYTGSAESFAQIVEVASPALVVAAGGPKLETDADVFQMAYDVVQSGAAGITFGRNIWQSEDPQRMVEILNQIVHHGATPEAALKMWRERE
jgi:DhnA family fructose-bisphosphate aldolase class Ia